MPESSRTSRGVLMHQLLPISDAETIATILPVSTFAETRFLLLLTKNGFIKKTVRRAI